jgi:hypothetical protein
MTITAIDYNVQLGKYEIRTHCPLCNTSNPVVLMTRIAFNKWHHLGHYLEDVTPTLTTDERELLITGWCSTCWDQMKDTEDE